MTRPSKNVDRILIKAGVAILQEDGITQLNIRDLVERAGVNLGMFHYHFKTKNTFLRIVLQEIYEKMFSKLTRNITTRPEAPAIVQLRQVLFTITKFLQNHRQLIFSIANGLILGSNVVSEFVAENFPRHIRLVYQLVAQAQREKSIAKIPIPNILAFIVGAMVAPLLVSGIVSRSSHQNFFALLHLFEKDVLSDKAIQKRIDMALKGVSP